MSIADIELEGWPEPAAVVISTMSRRRRRAIASSSLIGGRVLPSAGLGDTLRLGAVEGAAAGAVTVT
jgi:hypothetical protein